MADIVEAWLTNTAYGYPNRGDQRRIAPTHLAILHITANPNTPPATAIEERNHANRVGSEGPSAHDYVERSGVRVRAIDPVRFAGWSNGVLRSPKLTVPGVQAVIDFDQRLVPGSTTTYNPNEAYFREIEHVGRYSQYPITLAQAESTSVQIAEDSLATGIPISRATVHLHSDIDTEQRPNCPVPAANAEAWVAGVITRAQVIKQALMEAGMDWDQLLAALDAEYKRVVAERDAALQRANAAEAANVLSQATIAAKQATIDAMGDKAREIVALDS